MFLAGGGRVGDGMIATLDVHVKPDGEMTVAHPEHPMSVSTQSTVVARHFMTSSDVIDLPLRRVARQGQRPTRGMRV
jgi:hypothetical protein